VKPGAKRRYAEEAVARKVRAAHRAPATNKVSGPTFFEISKRPHRVFIMDLGTGEALEFNLKTAKFTTETK
jgi:hypothetical protein